MSSICLNNNDVLGEIFSYFTTKEVAAFALVSKKWREAVEIFFENKFKDFPSQTPNFNEDGISLTYKEIKELNGITNHEKMLSLEIALHAEEWMLNNFAKFVRNTKYGQEYIYTCAFPIGSQVHQLQLSFGYASPACFNHADITSFKVSDNQSAATYFFERNLSVKDVKAKKKVNINTLGTTYIDRHMLGNQVYYRRREPVILSTLLPGIEEQMKKIFIDHADQLRNRYIISSAVKIVKRSIFNISVISLYSFATYKLYCYPW